MLSQACLLFFACACLSLSSCGVCDGHKLRPGLTTKTGNVCAPVLASCGSISPYMSSLPSRWVCAARPSSAPQAPTQLQCCGPLTNFMRLSLWLVSFCHRCLMPQQSCWPIFPLRLKSLTVIMPQHRHLQQHLACSSLCSSSRLRPCHEHQGTKVCHLLPELFAVRVKPAGHCSSASSLVIARFLLKNSH